MPRAEPLIPSLSARCDVEDPEETELVAAASHTASNIRRCEPSWAAYGRRGEETQEMRSLRFFLIGALTLLPAGLLGAGAALAAPPDDGEGWVDDGWTDDGQGYDDQGAFDDGQPDGNTLLSDGYYDADGNWVEGSVQDVQRSDSGALDPWTTDGGDYVAPDITTSEQRPGYTWEDGYSGDDSVWAKGFWREQDRPGFTWVAGYYDGGAWVSGHWEPNSARDGYVWVPGYVDADGSWVPGAWREVARDGYSWTDGYYVDNDWYSGYWRPLTLRSGYVWVPGTVVNGYWAVGYWRPAYRAGYSWAPGYWYSGRWYAGGWHRGAWSARAGYRVAHYAGYDHRRGFVRHAAGRNVRHVRYASNGHRPRPTGHRASGNRPGNRGNRADTPRGGNRGNRADTPRGGNR
ncbi:MAG: hypothetical protein CVU56_29925, partial [Deltaproteobacteria bacterium HGW-Deltaproteobacteria-14]